MRKQIGLVWATALLAGCNSPEARLNAPPHGHTESTSDLQMTFVHMTDNAMLHDMTVADMHFMPHRAKLTTLGEERLTRLAGLMEEYGGDIRFNTNLEDTGLIAQRVQAIRDFLADSGVDTTSMSITPDMPGGPGMDARESILIKMHEGTYDPKKKSSASAGSAGFGFGASDSSK